jgi:translation initiation factor 2B subunit (eIF-2B alpha/beta/delta family)
MVILDAAVRANMEYVNMCLADAEGVMESDGFVNKVQQG